MLRSLINQYLIENVHDKNVAVLFSGGLDSLSVLLSCLDIGINPHLYTFRLSNYESEDSKSSKRIADIFNLPLTEVILNVENINLVEDIKTIMNMFNVKKKTQIQCIQPFLYVSPQIKERVVLTGLGADDLYGNTKRMAILSKTDEQLFNNRRLELTNDCESGSYCYIEALLNSYGKILVDPYKFNAKLKEYMIGKTYKELNSPKRKNETYISYKQEIDRYDLFRVPSGFQCNSKIREWHDTLLLNNDINTNNHKNVVGIYNKLYKQIKNS